MFDISNTLLLYRELNNKRNIYVSKRADRKYAPAAHGIDLMMVLYVLCVCGALKHKFYQNRTTAPWMHMKSNNQGALYHGLRVSCLEPECITYDGRGYMSFLWRVQSSSHNNKRMDLVSSGR